LNTQVSVLVVEDEPFIRLSAVGLLEAAGFKVYEAADADEAISILERVSDIWAIFTDIDMPGSMDGIRLAHAVRDRWPPVHIFITSGHRTPEEKELPDKALFFSKPYDEASVIAAFHTLRAG